MMPVEDSRGIKRTQGTRAVRDHQKNWLAPRCMDHCGRQKGSEPFSNNYLGFANHPRLKEAAKKGIDDYGAGPAAVRTMPAISYLRKN